LSNYTPIQLKKNFTEFEIPIEEKNGLQLYKCPSQDGIPKMQELTFMEYFSEIAI
jgi:hypothetical protein